MDSIAEPAISPNSPAPDGEPGWGAHLTFAPASLREPAHFFLWGKTARDAFLALSGHPARFYLLDEDGQVRAAQGYHIPLLDALRALVGLSTADAAQQPSSIQVWSLAAKLACELVVRERSAPTLLERGGELYASSCVSLGAPDDAARVQALAKAFPLAAHATPIVGSESRIWSAAALLREFLNAAADALTRPPNKKRKSRAKIEHGAWQVRWVHALSSHDAHFASQGFAERELPGELQRWNEPALAQPTQLPRLRLQLMLPARNGAPEANRSERFTLEFALWARERNVAVDAQSVYRGDADKIAALGCAASVAEECLLRDLSLAGRLFAPIQRALRAAYPDKIELDAEAAWQLLSQAKPILEQAGVAVTPPIELQDPKQYRLQLRMRIGATAGAPADAARIGYAWEAELAGELLNQSDIEQLMEHSPALRCYRERWVAVEREELELAQRLLRKRGGQLSIAAALAAVLSESIRQPGSDRPIAVAADGDIADKLRALRAAAGLSETVAPPDFCGQLRPYQLRGVAWLEQLAQLGLGACLADDMGLGKTIQLIAYLLRRRQMRADDARPTLLICPTSVIGNWQRELAKFAPSLPVVVHEGAGRAANVDALGARAPHTVVLTSYALLRRDAALMTGVDWAVAALDEAQNIKNAESIGARVARGLQATVRIALTGTPVENRLDELWSICEFLNPGLLGPLATFRREIAIPIERFGREDAAETLRRIVRPFILRRTKSDPRIIQDLPSKQESREFCLLTREQAALYKSVVEESMLEIEAADGIERRGQVLKLITALKQICNHPAQYLKEDGPLAQRSGKLERLRAMLEETLADGERALIFTQYREMGARLTRELTRHFGRETLFLHGGVPRAQRDVMIERFNKEPNAPAIFVLSVKAGGAGLNLAAATHVFHYDRWWNPAVEDQATDRAYRIGQTQRVQVHKFLCAGTVEERIDAMLENKRDLAGRIVGEGEQWLTELDNEQLRELFALSPTAIMEDDALENSAEPAA